MPRPQILILTAVQIEAKAIAKALRLTRRGTSWQDADRHITLQMIGICGRRLAGIDQAAKYEFAILAGLAGALDPSLKAGDVIMDDCPAELVTGFSWHMGRIHSTSQIVATSQAKEELFSRSKALAVEMEAHVVRPWAVKSGAKFISIRAISDAASQSLDPTLVRIVDDLGRARHLTLAVELLRRPSILPGLFRLAKDSQQATCELGKAVRWMVSRIEAENRGLSPT